jgi:hypothetical protein
MSIPDIYYSRKVMRTKSGIVYTQIAIFPWANVGLLLYTLLGQRWKLTLAQCDFIHQPNVIPNRWFNIDQTFAFQPLK